MLVISVPTQSAHAVQGLLSTCRKSSTLLSSLSDPTIVSAMVAIASSTDAPFFLLFLGAGAPDVPAVVAVDWQVDWLVGWLVDWMAGWLAG